MKKIALPVQGSDVSAHFGHAPEFKIFSIEDKNIISEDNLENPGHQPGLIPRLLNEAGADLVIASGMGQKAIAIFENNNIEVICGAAGKAKAAVMDYLNGELNASNNSCSHEDHDHQHNHDHHHGKNHN